MKQSNLTATIAEFLKSHYMNTVVNYHAGLSVDDNGDFLNPNVIINQTFETLFDGMELRAPVSDDFKKQFCKRYYNREIGFETFGAFRLALESMLNTDCFNLLKFADEIRNKSVEDLNIDHDYKTDNSANNVGQGLNIDNLTPQDKLELIYTPGEGLIDHANALNEQHNKNHSDTHTHAYGWAGGNLASRYADMATIPDLYSLIFEQTERLFLQVWG